MQIPIIQGIYTDNDANFRTAYPVNLVPVPKQQGISNGYLRPADGLVQLGASTGPGLSRGGINWNGVCYRVMGSKLVSIDRDGVITTLGEVGGSTAQVSMDYSFDRLAIASNNNLFYWNGTTLTQVTDVDLGTVLDVMWVDGYFMTTDGTNLVVTELTDPTSVNPTKYGSSEIDPDPVKAVLKIRNEPQAVNRYTIESFENIGGSGFPFQRIEGAQIQRGAVGTHACCVFAQEYLAFLGSGRNEQLSIYLGRDGDSVSIATREIEELLQAYSESQLSNAVLEYRNDKKHQHLWVHLPDRTLVYDAAATEIIGRPVWFQLVSTLDDYAQYRAKDLVWCYDRYLCGDKQQAITGYLTDAVSSQYGGHVRWEFSTDILYNNGFGAILHQLELVALTGRVALGEQPTISTSYSLDGQQWSQEKFINASEQGDRLKRLVWFQQGHMRNWRTQRFRSDSRSFLSMVRLEAQLEALAA